jgi:hypothetical protein
MKTKPIEKPFGSQLDTIFRPKDEDKGLHLLSLWNQFVIRSPRSTTVTRMMQKRQLAYGEEWVSFLSGNDKFEQRKRTTSEASSEDSDFLENFRHVFQNDSCDLFYDFARAPEHKKKSNGAVEEHPIADDCTLDHLAILSMNSNSPAVDVSNNYHYYNDYRTPTAAQRKSVSPKQITERRKKRKLSFILRGSRYQNRLSSPDEDGLQRGMPQEIMFSTFESNLVYV